MPNKLNKDTQAYKNKLAYIKQFNSKMRRYHIQFNPKKEADLIEWLEGKRKATYIKQLIREDMKKNRG